MDTKITTRRLRFAVLASAVALLCTGSVQAQQSWEYTPYQIRVWLGVGPSPHLDRSVFDRVAKHLVQRAEAVIGAPWTVTVEQPPVEVAPAISVDLNLVSAEQVDAIDPDILLQDDKVFLMSIDSDSRAFYVRVRELDCRTQYFGPTVVREVRQLDRLGPGAFDAMLTAFAPMVRIESGEETKLTTRLRAGGLILDKESPLYIAEDDILQPIVRRNDRLGKPTRIDVVEWTFLQVESRDKTNPNLLECHVHSAMRSPIRGRGGSRREQYALAIRPLFESTQLVVEAQVRRDDTPYPLPGLEVYSKIPSTKRVSTNPEEKLAAERQNPAELLGHTDWRGALAVERYSMPLRIVYLKNGGQLLRRLPIVPGLEERVSTQVPDDDPRLQAEGFMKGFQGEFMDLVAQRQILAARVRKRIADGDFDGAQTLVEEFRALPSRNDMVRKLDQAQSRQRDTPNQYVRGRIQSLYGDTRTMLSEYLDPALLTKLNRELSAARQSGGGPAE